jgi:predicted nucleic acid-binding protein
VNLYLDTSALVKLYIAEEGSLLVRTALADARFVATSVVAYVEARAAFARRRQERALSSAAHRRLVQALDTDWGRYLRIEASEALIHEAALLAERHRLRGYDAIHLASALLLRSRLPEAVVFSSWDFTLQAAALREGLRRLPDRFHQR